LNDQGQLLDGYPETTINELTPEDMARLHYVENAQGTQIYINTANAQALKRELTFIIPVKNERSTIVGILLGRTDLDANPIAQAILLNLKSNSLFQGEGFVLDEYGRIVLSSTPNPTATISSEQIVLGFTSFGNKRQLVRPVQGTSWIVLISVSENALYDQTINNVWAFILVIFIVGIECYAGCFLYLRRIYRDIRQTSENLAAGSNDLLSSLPKSRFPELQKLREVFQSSYLDLSSQLTEKEELLRISNAVQNLGDISETCSPILDLITTKGADCARLLFSNGFAEIQQEEIVCKSGATADLYAYLDDQIKELLTKQDQVMLPYASRSKQLNLMPGFLQPGALAAFALKYEGKDIGILWAAFDQPKNFTKDDLHFYEQMVAEIEKAFTLLHHFRELEEANNRIKLVLDQIPLPVYIFEGQNKLWLVNKATDAIPQVLNESWQNKTC